MAGTDVPGYILDSSSGEGSALYVNQSSGSDSNSGAVSSPMASITAALEKIHGEGRFLKNRRTVVVTGTTLHREKVVFPPFASQLDTDFSSGPFELTTCNEPINVVADLEYGTQTALTAVSWVADTPTGLMKLTVTGVTVAADELVGRCLIGSGPWEVAWIGRNTLTTGGGETTLNLTTNSEFTAPIRLCTPIDLRAPDGETDSTIIMNDVRCGVSFQGLRISHPGASAGRSISTTGCKRTWFLGCAVDAGYFLFGQGQAEFYQTKLSSQTAFPGTTNASRSCASQGFGVSFTGCLFLQAYVLTIKNATSDGYYLCYSRGSHELGHGGGVYLNGSQYDFHSCWIDTQSNQGGRAGIAYLGGDRCSIDACRIENCDNGVGVAEAGGGLRVKNVAGINNVYGIRVGQNASPYLEGGGVVRISATTSVTGGTGDTYIGQLGATSYVAIRAATGKSILDPATGSRIWEP